MLHRVHLLSRRTTGSAAARISLPLLCIAAAVHADTTHATRSMASSTAKTDAEWKQLLTPEQYRVLREKGTERPYSSPLDKTFADGEYKCAGCGETLFFSDAKFNSGCGWPAFFQPAAAGAVTEHVDRSFGSVRTEVVCKKCGGHLGHVFSNEGHKDSKTGLRYCINGQSLKFEKKA